MPAPLPAPCIPPGFPPLAGGGGQTTHPTGLTVLRTKAGGQTTSLGGQTAPGIEVGSPTTTPVGQTTSHHVAPSSAALPTSAAPHAVPSTPPVPRSASTSMTPPASCVAPVSTTPPAPPVAPMPQHYLCRPRAAQEPMAPPLYQQSPPVKDVTVAPPVNPHPMTTWMKRGFRLPADKLMLSATSSSLLSPVPTSVRTALADLSWHRAMEGQYDALIRNNT
jgi:hypothetical protein